MVHIMRLTQGNLYDLIINFHHTYLNLYDGNYDFMKDSAAIKTYKVRNTEEIRRD